MNILLLGLYRYYLKKDSDTFIALFFAQIALSIALFVALASIYIVLHSGLGWISFDIERYPKRIVGPSSVLICYGIIFTVTKKRAGLEHLNVDERKLKSVTEGFWCIYILLFTCLIVLAFILHP